MPCHIIFHIFPLSLIKSSYLAPGEGPPSLIWTPCARRPAPGARHPAPRPSPSEGWLRLARGPPPATTRLLLFNVPRHSYFVKPVPCQCFDWSHIISRIEVSRFLNYNKLLFLQVYLHLKNNMFVFKKCKYKNCTSGPKSWDCRKFDAMLLKDMNQSHHSMFKQSVPFYMLKADSQWLTMTLRTFRICTTQFKTALDSADLFLHSSSGL